MFKFQCHLIARLAANIMLVLAIIATPSLLAPYVDMGASAEAAPWPNKASKYKKDKPLKRVKPLSESFIRKYDRLDKAKEKEDWVAYGKIIKSMKARYDKYHEGEKVTFLWREVEYLYAIEGIKGDKNPNYNSNYRPVIKNFETLLTLHKSMRESGIKEVLSSLADLHAVSGTAKDYRQALYYHHQWMGMTNVVVKPERKFRIGNIHFQLEEFDPALEWIEESMADIWALDRVPKESAFELQKYIYHEKKNPAKVAAILEQLVEYYPKKKYWEQLGVVYQQGLERPKDALASFDLLYMQDKLTKASFIKTLAYAYRTYDAPYKLTQLYEWGIDKGYLKENAKNLKILYYAYRDAAEVKKGIATLERYNKLESDASMFNLLSDEYIKDNNYAKAAEAARKARTATKKAKKTGESHYREGVALFYLKKFEKSLAAFKRAKKDPAMKKHVEPWQSYVEFRIEKLKELKETGRLLRKDLAKG